MSDLNDKLQRAGAALASNAFILGQPAGPGLTPEIRATLAACCRAWDEALRATPAPQAAPSDLMVSRVDAAMTAMRNIVPPLRRSECEQLIRAALAAAPAVAITQAATSEPVAWGCALDLAFKPLETRDLEWGAVCNWNADYEPFPLYRAPVAHLSGTTPNTEAPSDERAALEAARNAAYPVPDSPHASVNMRAIADRTAFTRGWKEARAALSAQQAGVQEAPSEDAKGKLYGFDREDLRDMAEDLEGNFDQHVNTGNVTGLGDYLLPTAPAAAAKFIRAALASQGVKGGE